MKIYRNMTFLQEEIGNKTHVETFKNMLFLTEKYVTKFL